jgi:hypothetical protein
LIIVVSTSGDREPQQFALAARTERAQMILPQWQCGAHFALADTSM